MTEENQGWAEEPAETGPEPDGWAAPKGLSLPGTYHKARARLVLFSAVLLVWDVVGIQLSAIPVIGLQPTRNPEAIPWLVALAVLYFGFRFEVEWRQYEAELQRPLRELLVRGGMANSIDIERFYLRAIRACFSDRFASYWIGAIALGVFVFQHLSDVRVAEVPAIAVGGFVGLGLGFSFQARRLLSRFKGRPVSGGGLGIGVPRVLTWAFVLAFVLGCVWFAFQTIFHEPLSTWPATQYLLASIAGWSLGMGVYHVTAVGGTIYFWDPEEGPG